MTDAADCTGVDLNAFDQAVTQDSGIGPGEDGSGFDLIRDPVSACGPCRTRRAVRVEGRNGFGSGSMVQAIHHLPFRVMTSRAAAAMAVASKPYFLNR